ncbi:S-adenosyl-L-methionine-dependent methyltransferases superfamily protein [Striga hermonthica]|uniref:S-adenosyl-L-methionine-dependent methyltransferases superfamily protein n=1 Tax=Striga hermonthica TaxID=68872 RepID=A0A9N7RJQ8_STRHE|nr:S-adenosyl-L-methionine-dependent methyltransferases superfamily protein [Striga hermonthica]
MAAEQELDVSNRSWLHMISAFRALEPPDAVISIARELGGGSITESVQSCIWRHCISKADLKWQGPYLKRFLKKLIFEIESGGGLVLDELYEQYASYMISLQDDEADQGNSRVLKTITFLFPNGDSSGFGSCLENLEVPLRCSVNMLEGDTGCSIWPSSLFLSEFIISYPELFANKSCFEFGSGVGLVGVCLAYVKASKVILSDGDLSTLANMKVNLELNHLSPRNHTLGNLLHHDMVNIVCLPWESASEDDLRCFAPDVILGADIIYDPSYLPHLVRVLVVLLKNSHSDSEINNSREFCAPQEEKTTGRVLPNGGLGRVAYFASVIRNIDTFNCFVELAEGANLVVTDLTENVRVSTFLPYLRSYPRSTIRLFRIHR